MSHTVSTTLLRPFLALTLLVAAASGQITSTGIRGLVRDPSGAVVPGATLKLEDTATRIETSTVSSSDGVFAFPSLQPGAYRLTATAAGFQSIVLNAIAVDSGRITDVSVDLKVGAATESVQVSASAVQLEVTSNEVGTTISNNLIQKLPYSGRDTLAFATLMAGNASSDGTARNSTFNGLPNASMNISLDGMNNNSQRFKSGGTSFFQFAPSRLDAIEQLTVSTTGLGADAGGEGAMNIRLVTKRGTEQYHGKVLEQFRNEDLNANSFFNNLRGIPRTKVRENDAVGSIGGPLLPFIPYFKRRLFFFAYFEGIPQPSTATTSAAIFTPASQAGNFTYLGTDGTQRTVNLLQAVGGTLDPTTQSILSDIAGTRKNATTFTPISGQPYWETMQWNQASNTTTLYPTARVDYQITPKIGWHGTWNLRYQNIAGTPQYPGDPYDFPNAYKITTYVATNSVDWAVRPNLLNNFSFGVQSNGEYFYQGADPRQYAAYGNRILNIPFTTNPNVINPYVPSSAWLPFIRNNPVFQWTDNLNWVRGKHTLTMGATALRTTFWETSFGSAGVPQFNFGVASADAIGTAIQNALPSVNLNNGDLGNAQNLYAFLTGRITSITQTVNVDENTHQYQQFSPVTQRFAFTTGGLYLQDSFRWKTNFTLNIGLRWQLDGAIHSTNGINTAPTGPNFFGPSNGPFQPGVLNGNLNPVYVQSSNPYSRDINNFAPNVGFAWNPQGGGFLGKLLGNRKTVIRSSFAITYYNEGLNAISNVLSGGRGTSQSGSATNGVQFTPGTLFLRSAQPAISLFPASFTFPLPESAYTFSASGFGGSLIDPGLRSPYVTNWTFAVQRQLAHATVLEVRYVGNKSTHMWHSQNIQETNIFENGFLNEFNQAKANRDINLANGRGATFVNNGLAGQAALPIFDAAFGANGSLGVLTAAQGFGSTGFITNLDQGAAGSLANTLATNPTYFCRLVGNGFSPCANIGYAAPGKYPINFFRMNPFLDAMTYQTDNGDNNYNALQLDLRHQLSYGLVLQANYTWSHSLGDLLNATNQTAGYTWYTTRDARLSYGPSPFDRRHVFNAFWTFDLPFGRGRKLNVTNPALERVVGGWTIGGRQTVASGSPNFLSGGRNTVNNLSSSGVTLNNLSLDQLQHALSTVSGYFAGARSLITDISSIATVTSSASSANPAYYAPAGRAGQWGALVYLRNNATFQLDMSLNKEIRIKERWRMNFNVEALNFLNHPFFPLGNTSPTATNFGQITTSSGTRNVQLRASVEW